MSHRDICPTCGGMYALHGHTCSSTQNQKPRTWTLFRHPDEPHTVDFLVCGGETQNPIEKLRLGESCKVVEYSAFQKAVDCLKKYRSGEAYEYNRAIRGEVRFCLEDSSILARETLRELGVLDE